MGQQSHDPHGILNKTDHLLLGSAIIVVGGNNEGSSVRVPAHATRLCGVSSSTKVDKNPLRGNFVSLVSIYGDRRPGSAPPGAAGEARAPSVAAHRSLPYLEVSPTESERTRGAGPGRSVCAILEASCLFDGVLTGLLMIHHAIRVIIDRAYSC